jgi:hypothetical protein
VGGGAARLLGNEFKLGSALDLTSFLLLLLLARYRESVVFLVYL